ncbi:hypothetical protein Taro_003723 [Colocasia esculenta]|uniref:RNase H type-1 domain-containing protein n=1 Tax=Colocasia esculenta TaxID=4460 RepID=A0A843TPR4_COLES|nr:hypothetical protein [Colocasia esculenta]
MIPFSRADQLCKSFKMHDNADVFGNINDNLQAAYEEVSAAEVSFDSSPTIYNRESLNRANAHLKYAQRCEEMFWSQKARLQWLDDGDKNTKFFHAIVQSNRRRNYISRLKIDGSNNWCDDQAVLRDAAARYFESLLSSDGSWEEATRWISSMIFGRGTLLFASCLLTRMMPLMSQSGRCCKIALSLPSRWFLICKSCPVFIFRKTRILASGPTQLMVFSTLDRPTTSCALGAFRDLLWQRFGIVSSFGKRLCFAGKSSTGIKIKLVRWIPPVYGLCLNVDGASKGNPGLSGGGGCIRDSNGNICLAFAFHYGFGNSLQAEVRALHDGLMLANEFGLSINQIYSDSALLVQSFTNNFLPSWECARWWRPAFHTLRSLQTSCCHVFREANKVADALASYATSNHGNKIFTTFSSLPLACRGPATLDKTGLPYVRLG